MNMKKRILKRLLPATLALTLICGSLPMIAKADESKVVTLGANLSDNQKADMYKYFGTTENDVVTIEVTNADERKYLEGVASDAQIGTRTLSCAYVEPTKEGGIQVKVANLTYVTSSMIASTLLTSGVENCNVVAACPIEVSGTGALTGIMMAYEKASGETLSEEQKSTATQELITTGDLAESVGDDKATAIMNDVKEQVIEDGITDDAAINDAVTKAAEDYGVTLTPDQINSINNVMSQISKYDYDVNALKDTIKNLEGKDSGFFAGIVNSIKNLFGGNSEGGIISDTNDSILGDNATINSTLDSVKNAASSAVAEAGGTQNLWDKIVNYVKDLLGSPSSSSSDSSDSSTK